MSQYSYSQKLEITEDQKKYITENYLTVNDAGLAKHLKVSRSKIYSWCKELGLGPRRRKCGKNGIKSEHYFDWSSAKKTDFIINNC